MLAPPQYTGRTQRLRAFFTSYAASHSHPHSTTGSQSVCWPADCHSTFPGRKAVTTLCLQPEIRDLNAKTWECRAESLPKQRQEERMNFEFTPLDLWQSGKILCKSEPLQESVGENIQASQWSHLQSWLISSLSAFFPKQLLDLWANFNYNQHRTRVIQK